MRYTRLAILRSRGDIAQSLTLVPWCDFFPWIRMGKICVRDLLCFLQVLQGGRELGEKVALVCFERTTSKSRSREARKQESLVGPKWMVGVRVEAVNGLV